METTLIDSPVANVANIARALRAAGADLRVTRDPSAIAAARKLVLPGVGSFMAAMNWLVDNRIDVAIRDAVAGGASLLGICVGHQLLFDLSHEMGTTRGLGLVRGEIVKYDGVLPVPQIGWNRVMSCRGRLQPALGGLESAATLVGDGVYYFVNSYAATSTPHEIARADYGGAFTAAVQNGRVFGVQFHPEKSSAAGLQVLRNFIAWM
jgi:glutamine amidotransferase